MIVPIILICVVLALIIGYAVGHHERTRFRDLGRVPMGGTANWKVKQERGTDRFVYTLDEHPVVIINPSMSGTILATIFKHHTETILRENPVK